MSYCSYRALRRALAGSLVGALVVGIGASGPALAQQEEPERIEEIHVTGTRIERVGIDTLQPATTITAESIERRGFTNVADALNDNVLFGPPGNSPVGSGTDQELFNAGANFVDFLGLGAQRTLTLVDGHRFVNSNPPSLFGAEGGLQVDFNVIPISLVERIETIATGGAPIYGSDAVAGTINVILRDDFEGFELSAQSGITDSNRRERHQVQATWGANTFDERGNVVLTAEYETTDGLLQDDRRDLFSRWGFFGSSSGDVTGDGEDEVIQQPLENPRINALTPTGTVSPLQFMAPNDPASLTAFFGPGFSQFPGADSPLQFDEAGNLVPLDPGEAIPGEAIWASGGTGWRLSDFEQAVSPTERVVGMAIGRYDLTENVTATAQFSYADTESEILRGQGGVFQTWLFGEQNGAMQFSTDHPMLTNQAQQTFDDIGADSFWINRVSWDLANQGRQERESQTWRVVAGVEGDFEVLDRVWQWDASVNFGESQVLNRDSGLNDTRFFNAVDAIELTEDDLDELSEAEREELESMSGTETAGVGDVICQGVLDRVTGETDPPGAAGVTRDDPFLDGCVPVNLFGQANQEALDWLITRPQAASELQQRVIRLNLIGDLFELPAGPVGFAVGYENREEQGAFEPDNFNETALGRSATILPTSGEFETDEFHGEVFVPLVAPDMGVPMLDNFSVEGAARSVDNDLPGAGRDTTFTAGGRIAFVPDLVLRGNFTRSIRSPAIMELFSPVTTSFSTAEDPCDAQFRDSGDQPENRQANCDAVGLPEDFGSNVVRATARGRTGGNEDLQNETADSWSVGVILEPRWMSGLVITADFFNIDMEDRITNLDLTSIMESCFDVDPADFPAPTCDNFERDEDGQVVDFLTGFENAAESEFEGLFISASYDWALADLMGLFNDAWGDMDMGRWSHQFDFNHRITNKVSVIGERAPELVGGFSRPDWAGTWDFQWTRGPVMFFWRMNWQTGAKFDPAGEQFFENLDGNVVNRSDMRIIHTATVRYQITNEARLRFTVNNVANHDPDPMQVAAGHFGRDEILGRRFLLNFRYQL